MYLINRVRHEFGILMLLMLVGFFYFKNLSPDVYGGDIGDLVTASYVAGVPHPPGYPLFTMLGFLLSHIPLPLTVAYKVGMISVMSSLGAIFFFYLLVLRITKSRSIACISSCVLAFSYLFWKYTELAEVFALNNFFATLLLYLGVRYFQNGEKKILFLLFFFLGLSLSHHHTILFIFPSIFFLLISAKKRVVKRRRDFITLLMLFLTGLIPYIYLPIAASFHPVISWQNPTTLKRFLETVLRIPYGTFSAGKFPSLTFLGKAYMMKYYLIKLIASVSFPVFLIAFVGMVYGVFKHTRIWIAIFSGFFLAGPFFVWFAGFHVSDQFTLATVERFYVFSSILVIYFFALGLVCIRDVILKKFLRFSLLQFVVLSFFLLPSTLFLYNSARTDYSSVKLGEWFGTDILSSVPKNAVLFLSGDYSVFDTWYVYYVLGKRQDIEIINPSNDILLVGNDVFMQKITADYKKSHTLSDSEKELFPQLISEIQKKKVITSINTFDAGNNQLIWVPMGMVKQLMRKEDVPDVTEYEKRVSITVSSLHVPTRSVTRVVYEDTTADTTLAAYSDSLSNIGDFFYYHYNDSKHALSYYKKSLEIDSRSSLAYSGMGAIEYEINKNCAQAEKDIKKALQLIPGYKMFYANLYKLYTECKYEKKVIDALKIDYYNLFKVKIERDM